MEMAMEQKKKFLDLVWNAVMGGILTEEDCTEMLQTMNRAIFRKAWINEIEKEGTNG